MANETKTQRKLADNTELAKTLNQNQNSDGSRYVSVKPNSVADLEFSGKIYETTNQFGNEVLEFELVEVISEGDNKGTPKVLTLSVKNPITRELVTAISQKQFKHKIMRAGEGKSSRYSIMKS